MIKSLQGTKIKLKIVLSLGIVMLFLGLVVILIGGDISGQYPPGQSEGQQDNYIPQYTEVAVINMARVYLETTYPVEVERGLDTGQAEYLSTGCGKFYFI